MAFDADPFSKLHTFEDYNRANQTFQMQKQAAQLDAMTKANTYATQVLSAATSTGDQQQYDNARRQLAANGIDVSNWSSDINQGAQQAQAARLAQSPIGALFNAQQKVIGNNISATNAMGSTDNQFMQPVPTISPLTGDVSITPTMVKKPAPLSPTAQKGMTDLYAPDQPVETPQTNVMPNPTANTPSVSKFSFRPQNRGETFQAYKTAQDAAFEQFKSDPNYIASVEKAKKSGDFASTNEEGANVQAETIGRLDQNLDALKEINKSLPEYGGIAPVGIKARAGLIGGEMFGDKGKGYDAYVKWDEVNQQQVVNAISDLVKGGQIRGNQYIEKIINRGYAIDPDAPRATRDAQIEILRNELKNAAIQAKNIAGGQEKYTPTLPANSYKAGEADFKASKVATPEDIAAFKQKYGIK